MVRFGFCMEGHRTIDAKGDLIQENAKLGANFKLHDKPTFLEDRYSTHHPDFNFSLRSRRGWIRPTPTQTSPRSPLGTHRSIKLKDGKEHKGEAFITTPYMIAKLISNKLAGDALAARVHYTNRKDFQFSKDASAQRSRTSESSRRENWLTSPGLLKETALLRLLHSMMRKGRKFSGIPAHIC